MSAPKPVQVTVAGVEWEIVPDAGEWTVRTAAGAWLMNGTKKRYFPDVTAAKKYLNRQ